MLMKGNKNFLLLFATTKNQENKIRTDNVRLEKSLTQLLTNCKQYNDDMIVVTDEERCSSITRKIGNRYMKSTI